MALRRSGELETTATLPEKVQKEKKKFFKKREKKDKNKDFRNFAANKHLLAVKPDEGYVFHSDYFTIDDQVASIVAFFHTDGAADNFAAFWGINKIPTGLGDDVEVILFEQLNKMSKGWIESHQTKAEGIAEMDSTSANQNGTNTTKNIAYGKRNDFDAIAKELMAGSSYMHANYRMLIKARDLDALDNAMMNIKRLYMDRFGTLSLAAYAGDQRKELSSLWLKNDKKIGKGFHFTSTELAGSYSLVTHGMEDPAGEYVGRMVGDVNTSAVLFDIDNYDHHTVIVNENYHIKLGRVHITDLWGSKISQSALMNNHKVVHLILDGCDLDKLGPKFKSFTYKLNMHQGAVNMFEMFGKESDELSIFPSQMQKLILMAEQAYDASEADKGIIRGHLEEIATQFYIDRKMWFANAKEHRDDLRVVNIPHNEVPMLKEFVSYLAMELKSALNASAKDESAIHALKILKQTFQNMLSNNGDLFNVITSDTIDGAKHGQRVIYDFGGLLRRGKGVAMAQFVNIIGFAVGSLGLGDTVIIHGADVIEDRVKDYVLSQFEHLWDKGGRVVYLYNHTDKMLTDKAFCKYDKADYTIFGNMTETTIAEYQAQIGQNIPPDLARLITNKSDTICYIRRGFDNVVFKQDLPLGIKETKKKGRLR